MLIKKNKAKGRYFENLVRGFLKQQGWFIYTKGVSTKGVDIFAIKNNEVLLIELKNLDKITKKQLGKLFNILDEKIKELEKEIKDKTSLKNIKRCILIKNKNRVYLSINKKKYILEVNKNLGETLQKFVNLLKNS